MEYVRVDRLKHIAEMGDFIPHGDDSFIDDDGITNRWAQRRRARLNNNQVVQGDFGTYTLPDQPLHVPPANEIYNTNNPEVLEAIRQEQERMNQEMNQRQMQAAIADNHQFLTDLAHTRAENTDPELREDLERLYRQMFRDV